MALRTPTSCQPEPGVRAALTEASRSSRNTHVAPAFAARARKSDPLVMYCTRFEKVLFQNSDGKPEYWSLKTSNFPAVSSLSRACAVAKIVGAPRSRLISRSSGGASISLTRRSGVKNQRRDTGVHQNIISDV